MRQLTEDELVAGVSRTLDWGTFARRWLPLDELPLVRLPLTRFVVAVAAAQPAGPKVSSVE